MTIIIAPALRQRLGEINYNRALAQHKNACVSKLTASQTFDRRNINWVLRSLPRKDGKTSVHPWPFLLVSISPNAINSYK